MDFLVIGSSSFSGSHFVNKLLKEGFKVIGVSRSINNELFLPYTWDKNKYKNYINEGKFIFQKIDLNKDLNKLIKLLDEFQPNYVVNFAAQGMVAESWLNPTHWYKTNVLSQVALHDVLRTKTYLKKYVHITTPEVYGSNDSGWIKENFNFNPSTPYAVSRAACDLHLQSFFRAYKFPVIFTRAANVYGPGQQLYRIIPRTILSCLSGKPMQLHGGGKSIRSFIHIEDVVSATLDLAINSESGSSWHISTKHAISIRDLVQNICNLTNIDFSKIVEIGSERLGKDQNYLLDSSNIRNYLNWNEKFTLDVGLKDTINWVEQNFEKLKVLPWIYKHKL